MERYIQCIVKWKKYVPEFFFVEKGKEEKALTLYAHAFVQALKKDIFFFKKKQEQKTRLIGLHK